MSCSSEENCFYSDNFHSTKGDLPAQMGGEKANFEKPKCCDDNKPYPQLVNEYHPGQAFTFTTEGANEKSRVFVATAVVNTDAGEHIFTGKGKSKKQSKTECCLKILRKLHDFKGGQNKSRSGQEPISSEDIETTGGFADIIQGGFKDFEQVFDTLYRFRFI